MRPDLRKYLAVYALYVAALHTFDGPWKNWRRGRWVDEWTLTHVFWGAVAQRMGLSEGEAVVLGGLNEVFEAWLRRNRPDVLWGTPEPWRNVLLDIGTTWLGWKLARRAT